MAFQGDSFQGDSFQEGLGPPLSPWFETPAFLPPNPQRRRKAYVVKSKSEFAYSPFQQYGWEIQPPQPPHPVPERRAAAAMRGHDGIDQVELPWQNAGWEVQPPQPPQRLSKRAAAIMRGLDGTELP